MRIIADINKVELRDFEPLISGAYRDKTIDVELSPEYDGLSVWAIFDRQTVKVEGGKCYTPTLERGTCSVGIYAVRLNNQKEIDLRYSPAPALINIEQGSYNSSLNSATTPTESEAEQIYALIDEAIKSGMLKGEKGDPGTPGKDGAPGKDGIPGKDGAPGKDGYTPIKGVDYFDGAKGEKGDRGEQGVKGDKGEKGEKGDSYILTEADKQEIAQKVKVPTKTSDLQNDSGYITADDAPPEVYVGSEEPQGNEVIWVDNSTTAENINATKAYVDEKCSEKWELINKISIDTQAVKIAITEDSHGNGFDLSKALLICSFMPSELKNGLSFRIFTERNKTSNWNDSWGISSSSTSGINDKATYMIMLLENINSQVFKTGYWCSANKSNLNGNIQLANANSIVAYGESNSLKTFEDNFANRIMKKIDQIVLTSYGQTFGKGSEIKIYGIRK